MILTQIETVETELQHKGYGQNKVLKLTGLKRRSRGYQERLKRIKDEKDMAKTRFRGFSAKNQGPKHKYAYKSNVDSAKDQGWTLGGISRETRGLDRRHKACLQGSLKVEGSGCEIEN
jgi:hypothetical protein